MNYALSLCLIICSSFSVTQISFGPMLTSYAGPTTGSNDLDSIRVISNTDGSITFFPTLFIQKDFKEKLSIKLDVGLRTIVPTFVVYNFQTPTSGFFVKKASTVDIRNLMVNLHPQLDLYKGRFFDVSVFAGATFNFNLKREQSSRFFDSRHPGVSEVINSLNNSIRSNTMTISYGVAIERKRIIAEIEYQQGTRFTDSINAFNSEYTFINTWRYLNFSLGYRILRLRKERG